MLGDLNFQTHLLDFRRNCIFNLPTLPCLMLVRRRIDGHPFP